MIRMHYAPHKNGLSHERRNGVAKRKGAIAIAAAIVLGGTLIAAQPAAASTSIGFPNCSNRATQVTWVGSNQVVWHYNGDYHWNGHYYAWSFTGDMLSYISPSVGWVTTVSNVQAYCP